jgi:hypothetical protein
MTPEEKKRMAELVALIQVEQDQKKFVELVEQLNGLLDTREQRFQPPISK